MFSPRIFFILFLSFLGDRGLCLVVPLTPLVRRKHHQSQAWALTRPTLLQQLQRRSLPFLKAAVLTYSDFRGHKTYFEVYSGLKNKNPEVILIHGFGCSTVYWRETIRCLQEAGYTVHAIDLLGQGKSDKPGKSDGITYSINLWAQQVDDYAKENISSTKNVVLVGNSMGSLVALAAATGDYAATTTSDGSYEECFLRRRTTGVGMYNCGIGMNSQNVEYDFEGIQRVLVSALFAVLNTIVFGNVPLLTFALDKVVTKELLRNILTGLYQYATDHRVDEALIDSFYYPAKDPGSPEALSQIYVNEPGATPWEIYKTHEELLSSQIPIHLVWGVHDGVTPLSGSVGSFFEGLALKKDTNISMDKLDAGHVPFDEVPSCNKRMVKWLNNISSRNLALPPSFFGLADWKLPFVSFMVK